MHLIWCLETLSVIKLMRSLRHRDLELEAVDDLEPQSI